MCFQVDVLPESPLESGSTADDSEERNSKLTLIAVNDTAFREIVGRHLDIDTVPRNDADEKLPHLAGEQAQYLMSVVQLDAKLSIRKSVRHHAFLFDGFLFGHV